MDTIVYGANKALVMVLMVSAPAIIVATVVGLMMGLFQTVTQLQEQTLPFGVKLMAVMACLFLLEHWMSTSIMNFALEMIGLAFHHAHR